MTQQEKDSAGEDEVFAATHKKGTEGAEAEDGLGWVDLKEDGGNR
jgi:hypothetical protein